MFWDGASEDEIKAAGRWSSDAYKSYIHPFITDHIKQPDNLPAALVEPTDDLHCLSTFNKEQRPARK